MLEIWLTWAAWAEAEQWTDIAKQKHFVSWLISILIHHCPVEKVGEATLYSNFRI